MADPNEELPPGAVPANEELPPGAVPADAGQPASTADLDAQLHKAYDDRPLWRKVLGLDIDPSALSPDLQKRYTEQQQIGKQIATGLTAEQAAAYGQGIKMGAKTIPFLALGPVGGAVSEAVGGGALGLGANLLTQGAGGFGLSKLYGATTPAAALGGALSVAGPLLGEAASPAAGLLEQSAARGYGQVLKPTTRWAKTETGQIMPQLLEQRPVAWSRAGLAEKAATQAEEAGQQIESTVQGLKGQMPTTPVIQGLQDLKQSYQVGGVSLRPEADNAIDTVIQQFQKMPPSISLQEGVAARRILDNAVAEMKGYSGGNISDASMTAVRREAAGSIREELAKASPDLATINQKYRFWKSLSDVMDATSLRQTGQADALGQTLGTAAGIGAGAVKAGIKGAGLYGTAAYALGKVFRSTAWKTASAATKMDMADALASGNLEAVMNVATKVGAAYTVPSKPLSFAGQWNPQTGKWEDVPPEVPLNQMLSARPAQP